MNRFRVPGPLGALMLAPHNTTGPHGGRLAGCVGNVVPELLRILEANRSSKTVPVIQKCAVYQDPKQRCLLRLPSWSACRDVRAISTGFRILLTQTLAPSSERPL